MSTSPFISSTAEAERIREHYDREVGRYERWAPIVEAVLGIDRMRGRLLARARGNVLEVAIGTGASLPHYPRECTITGVDLSAAMLARARRRAGALGRPVELHRMDARDLSRFDARFDTVVCCLALCTFPEPHATLGELARVCRPGGQLLFLEHGRSSVPWIARRQDAIAPWHFEKHRCHLTRDPQRLIEEASLRVRPLERRLLGMLSALHAAPAG